MKITYQPISLNSQKYNTFKSYNSVPNTISRLEQLSRASQIPFQAIHGIKVKKINIDSAKFKLIDEIDSKIAEADKYDFERNFDKAAKELLDKYIRRIKKEISHYKSITPEQKEELAEKYKSELNNQREAMLKKILDKIAHLPKDENDYNLLNKFRVALVSDNMDLETVYKSYYSKLSHIKTLKELKKKFPKLKLPKRPEDVIAKKIVNALPKDFFVQLEDILKQNNKDKFKAILAQYITPFLQEIFPDIYTKNKITQQLVNSIIENLRDFVVKLHKNNSINSIPTNPGKLKIFDFDKTLLGIDYDSFVISTLKQLYLEGKKLSEIVYTENGKTIRPSILSNSEYKIEKPDEKIKSFVKSAKQIQFAERNYDVFDNDELQARLLHYSRQQIGEDEEIFEHIVDFASSKMLFQDKSNLIKLLRLLDDTHDGKITVKELKTTIKEQNIRPVDTELIKASEREQFIEKQRLEQKAHAEFTHYCSQYDDLVDLMYKSNLEMSASICLSYRPKNNEACREITDKFVEIIKSHIKDHKIINSKKLEAEIKYLDKYYQTKQYEIDNPLLSEAMNFVKQNNKNADEVEIGQYIRLKEILDTYPTSAELLSEHDAKVLEIIKTKTENSTDAIKSLIKFDNYRNQEDAEKLKISNILQYFQADKIKSDRDILESIIENIYTKDSTNLKAHLYNKSVSVPVTITAKAKNEILEKKGFPLCVDYYREYEDKATRMAKNKQEDGIQSVGNNNRKLSKKYKQEIKILYDERLYSTDKDYVFDEFAPGLHK